MLSIIICSRIGEIPDLLKQNIHNTVGCEYELVVIDNSNNGYSIFSAYNTGLLLSQYPYLCFVHEDVEFVTSDWGSKVIQHLLTPNIGFIGVAGGRAVLRVPYDWSSFDSMRNIINSHYTHNNKRVDEKTLRPAKPQNIKEECVVLDGVFLCANKSLFDKISFDEQLGGFHCYDMDICLQAAKNQYQNYMIFDIDLRHFSLGNFNKSYIEAILSLHRKWNPYLPFFDITYDEDFINNVLYKAEKKTIGRFKKRLVRSRMKFEEIIPIVKHFVRLTGRQIDRWMLFFIYAELVFLRFESTIRGKMIPKENVVINDKCVN